MAHNLGFQPKSDVLRRQLIGAIQQREPGEVIVVHHITDKLAHLQCEIERRGPTLGITFERMFLK